MNKIFKITSVFILMISVAFMIACEKIDNGDCKVAESIELSSVVFNETEFENAESVEFSQKCDEVEIGGTINAMSAAQKTAFGVQDVSHFVALKIMFDKERTIASFKLAGNVVKCFLQIMKMKIMPEV